MNWDKKTTVFCERLDCGNRTTDGVCRRSDIKIDRASECLSYDKRVENKQQDSKKVE